MWPLMKKEIRENFELLVGCFAMFFVLLEIGAYRAGWTLLLSRAVYGESRVWSILGRESALSVDLPQVFYEGPLPALEWSLACILVPLVMSAFQVLGEKVRGTEPLLAHLPMSPVRLALAKLLAGLSMHGVLVLCMSLLVAIRLSTPGTIAAPFHPRAMLVLAWPSLAGAALYLWAFAALMRPARWYATKWLLLAPVIPVFASALCLSSVTNTYQPRFPEMFRFEPRDSLVLRASLLEYVSFDPSEALVLGAFLLMFVSSVSVSLWAILRSQVTTEC